MSSPIDKIFKEIFGKSPRSNKRGAAFEQLAAIAAHIISGGDVKHDNKLRGEFSKTLYQLDVHYKAEEGSVMGEAKDYTVRNGRVGRGDLQKLGGALPDLTNIDAGSFFSATGYTKPARKYAAEAEGIAGKPITLYGLRPSTEVDEQGYIKTIVITMDIVIPQQQSAKWLPHISPKGQEALKVLLKKGDDRFEDNMELHCLYDKEGKEKIFIQELTSHGYGDINKDTGKSHACFILREHYININGVLAEIYGLEYEMPYSYHIEEIRISDESENRLVLLDSDENILKIITDEKLREYEFAEDGTLRKR